MKINEELLDFKYELGNTIAQWGYVEYHVLNIALLCVSHADKEAMAITYHSVENFRSKVAMCGNLVRHRFGKSKHFSKWQSTRDRLERAAVKRNAIAHGWHKLYENNMVGRRWAIIPLHHADGSLLHVEGVKPPSGAICLRELVGIRLDFRALTTQCANTYELLSGRAAPFPESDEQPARPPQIRRIGDLIRAEFGLQFLPSPQKP
jgi:hypothetical protein